MTETVIDLRGLRCPLPALRTEKALRGLTPGDFLRVQTDDPLARIDIAHLCRTGGHHLLEAEAEASHHRFLIRRGGDGSSGDAQNVTPATARGLSIKA